MKVIVFGLGTFGIALSKLLTEMGNEVIGIDTNMQKIEMIKDDISLAICLDSTNETAYDTIPLEGADIAIVALANEGAVIMTTAIIKKLNRTIRIISRSVSDIHDTVLKTMGIDEILHPEKQSAIRLAYKLNNDNFITLNDLDNTSSIIQIKCPNLFVGKKIADLALKEIYNVILVTISRVSTHSNLIFNTKIEKNESIGVIPDEFVLKENDILYLFGHKKDLKTIVSI